MNQRCASRQEVHNRISIVAAGSKVFDFTVSRHRDGPDQFLIDRQTLRDSDSRPIWARLCELLDGDVAKRVLPKDKIAEALNYVRHHREPLSHYLTDRRLSIDNNDVEQPMKQVAIGRKN